MNTEKRIKYKSLPGLVNIVGMRVVWVQCFYSLFFGRIQVCQISTVKSGTVVREVMRRNSFIHLEEAHYTVCHLHLSSIVLCIVYVGLFKHS